MKILALFLISLNIYAQVFDSGSDGSDGSFSLTESGSYNFFDPATFSGPVDQDGDGIYHFTDVNIGSGVILYMQSMSSGPVIWLVSGDVSIDGDLFLHGYPGHETQGGMQAVPGAGGFPGGLGGNLNFQPTDGLGPGGGKIGDPLGAGDGAGHLYPGASASTESTFGGKSYGNVFALPLIGGSGGAGGYNTTSSSTGYGGGAGGGAILIASSGTISLDGRIYANGGRGSTSTTSAYRGGAGSGGTIRLVSQNIKGSGNLNVAPGSGGTAASAGRIRLEAYSNSFTGSVQPTGTQSTPGMLFLSPESMPLRITTIDGQAVSTSPTGSVVTADIILNTTSPIIVEVATKGIPVGTTVNVIAMTETGTATAESSPLTGTVDSATAEATITLPHGLTRLYAEANWNPNAKRKRVENH